MNCRVCNISIDIHKSTAVLLGQTVKYYECKICGYVQTQKPTWLKEAYSSAINSSDTGIISRNILNVNLVLATLHLLDMKSHVVVDYASGYGFLVRMLRDIGVDAYWMDPFCDNIVARGFEYQTEQNNASILTAFEVFEHLEFPLQEVTNMTQISPNILFSTLLMPEPTPLPSEWWYYGLDHGQHIGFFRERTLKFIANKLNLNLISDGISNHLFTRKKYSRHYWKLLIRLGKISPSLFQIGLSSKTWTDHQYIVQSQTIK